MSRSHRPVGGQIGNRNGLKSGFYSTVHLTPHREDSLAPEAYGDELERAIVVARMTLRSVVEKDPGNYRLIDYKVSLLHRLIRTRHLMSDQDDTRHRCAVDKLARQLSITQNPNQTQEGPC